MGKATHDEVGAWAVVTRLSDNGLVVRLDSGPTWLLGHHDMAGHGQLLTDNRRVWLQLQWGWLWAAEIGISVQLASRFTPCQP